MTELFMQVVFGVIKWSIFGYFIILFKHPKVMLPLTAFSVGVLIFDAGKQPPPPPPVTSAGANRFCQAGETPQYRFGFAELKRHLGPKMGEPTECDHISNQQGDTTQTTTAGVAHWNKATNTPTFSTGAEHWAITPDGVVQWTGDAESPPLQQKFLVANTGGIGTYLRRTPKLTDRLRAWPDKTIMLIVGQDTTADDITWKNVRDPAGNVGWVPSPYLVPTK